VRHRSRFRGDRHVAGREPQRVHRFRRTYLHLPTARIEQQLRVALPADSRRPQRQRDDDQPDRVSPRFGRESRRLHELFGPRVGRALDRRANRGDDVDHLRQQPRDECQDRHDREDGQLPSDEPGRRARAVRLRRQVHDSVRVRRQERALLGAPGQPAVESADHRVRMLPTARARTPSWGSGSSARAAVTRRGSSLPWRPRGPA